MLEQVWFQNRRMKHKRQTVTKDEPEMKETKSKSESGPTGKQKSTEQKWGGGVGWVEKVDRVMI